MSSFTKMAMNDINKLKNNLNQLYKDSFELHALMLNKLRVTKNKINKRSWEYATYAYLKSTFYEKKNKYKKLYKTIKEIENLLRKEIKAK